jgi:hypothetical protein
LFVVGEVLRVLVWEELYFLFFLYFAADFVTWPLDDLKVIPGTFIRLHTAAFILTGAGAA